MAICSVSFDGSFRSRRVVIVLLLLLLMLAGAGWCWWSARPAAVLAGQVVGMETDKLPVSGAEVSILGTQRSVRTDRQGRFRLALLPAGPARVRVAAPGYDSKILTADINRGVETWIDVALASNGDGTAPRPAGSLAGQVVDAESGQPLAEARVVVAGGDHDPVYTGQDGTFALRDIRGNRAEIQVELRGYCRGTTSWLAEDKPLLIKLSGSSSLRGRVVSDAYVDVKPIAGATVRLAGTNKTAQSDHDGRFCITSLPGGTKNVGVDISAEGYASGHIDTDLPDEGEVAIDPRLLGAATLTGTVTDRVTNKPVAKATVALQGTQLKVQSGVDGKFTLSSVPPGVQTVCAFADQYGVAEKVATVTPKRMPPIELALLPGSKLHGTVVWQGSSDSSVPISAATVSIKGTSVSVSTDRSGRFALDGLPPEKVTLVVKALGFRAKEVERDPRSDIGSPIQLSGDSSITGRVVDAIYDPPRPIANATVRIDQSALVTHSDKDGRFTLEGVPSGPAKVKCHRIGLPSA